MSDSEGAYSEESVPETGSANDFSLLCYKLVKAAVYTHMRPYDLSACQCTVLVYTIRKFDVYVHIEMNIGEEKPGTLSELENPLPNFFKEIPSRSEPPGYFYHLLTDANRR